MPTIQDLNERARAILLANDRGGYTVPTARLYPFQWNWDSALCALGFATFDRDRAWRELETLVEGQWDDGMIPHIVFRRPDPDYFPGPDAWGTEGRHPPGMPTSGISQPPVLASVVRRLAEDGDAERMRPLVEACARWHRWWHEARCDDGITVVVHPWESGRDNCPDWDGPLDRVTVADDLPSYVRRDTGHIDADQRPRQAQYDRYMTIVKFGRDRAWDADTFKARGPFRVGDPGCHFILMRAERDLMALCRDLRMGFEAEAAEGRLATLQRGAEALWNEAVGAWTARDMRTGEFSGGASSASTLAWWGGMGLTGELSGTLSTLDAMLEASGFGVPSWDPRDEAFDAPRYWRGPVWAIVNFMVAEGLAESGYAERADRIRADTTALIEAAGFMEYFDPRDGRGLGGGEFSWTAAMWLAWCAPFAEAERKERGEAAE